MKECKQYKFARAEDIVFVSIDPGTIFSGVCTFDKNNKIIHSQKLLNDLVLFFIKKALDLNKKKDIFICIERITPQQRTGKSTIDTIFYCGFIKGRLFNNKNAYIVYASRRDVKKQLLGKGRWKDKDVRKNLIDRFGTNKIKTLKVYESKAGSGFVAADAWSALALFCAIQDNSKIASKEW
jgi:hypothetical protein